MNKRYEENDLHKNKINLLQSTQKIISFTISNESFVKCVTLYIMIKIVYSVGFHQIFPKFNNNERNINNNSKCAIKIQITKNNC